jgi:hypothetical protein
MKLRILGHKILFQFVQKVTGGTFESKTDWNFQIKSNNDDPKFARWAKAVNVGPEVTDVQEGDYILIEPLMWTTHMELDNAEKVWGTNRDKVIAVSKKEPTGLI